MNFLACLRLSLPASTKPCKVTGVCWSFKAFLAAGSNGASNFSKALAFLISVWFSFLAFGLLLIIRVAGLQAGHRSLVLIGLLISFRGWAFLRSNLPDCGLKSLSHHLINLWVVHRDGLNTVHLSKPEIQKKLSGENEVSWGGWPATNKKLYRWSGWPATRSNSEKPMKRMARHTFTQAASGWSFKCMCTIFCCNLISDKEQSRLHPLGLLLNGLRVVALLCVDREGQVNARSRTLGQFTGDGRHSLRTQALIFVKLNLPFSSFTIWADW